MPCYNMSSLVFCALPNCLLNDYTSYNGFLNFYSISISISFYFMGSESMKVNTSNQVKAKKNIDK